jgi:hypothetical protein
MWMTWQTAVTIFMGIGSPGSKKVQMSIGDIADLGIILGFCVPSDQQHRESRFWI